MHTTIFGGVIAWFLDKYRGELKNNCSDQRATYIGVAAFGAIEGGELESENSAETMASVRLGHTKIGSQSHRKAYILPNCLNTHGLRHHLYRAVESVIKKMPEWEQYEPWLKA